MRRVLFPVLLAALPACSQPAVGDAAEKSSGGGDRERLAEALYCEALATDRLERMGEVDVSGPDIIRAIQLETLQTITRGEIERLSAGGDISTMRTEAHKKLEATLQLPEADPEAPIADGSIGDDPSINNAVNRCIDSFGA